MLPTSRVALQLEYRDTVRRLHEGYRVGVVIHSLAFVGLHADATMAVPHQFGAEVFVVHADQTARGASVHERKVLYGVAVGTELTALFIDRRGLEPRRRRQLIRIKIRSAGEKAVAPARD